MIENIYLLDTLNYFQFDASAQTATIDLKPVYKDAQLQRAVERIINDVENKNVVAFEK